MDCAMKVHRALGPGLLERAYRTCLVYELRKAGFSVQEEMPIPLEYDSVSLDCGFRADLVVDSRMLVELKSVDHLLPIHAAQVLTYLKLTGLRVGLIINFNTSNLRQGVRRLVL
jgi:GxxExxY protein